MDCAKFREWLAHVDDLSAGQRREASAALSGQSAAAASIAAVEAGVEAERRCPRCQATGAVSIGRSRGLRRYRCKGCGRTFNAATGTPLSGLHYKERWLSFGSSLSEGETVRASAGRCDVAPSTAFRWRHRFLKAVETTPERLRGIVEADETFFLRSRKGERKLGRKARRRGGKAAKTGLSREHVPVLAVADRGGANASAVLPKVSAEALREALAPVVASDIVLVSDANRAYPPCAAALGVRHEALNMTAGERVRGAFHIQTVNSRHSQLKDFMRRFHGVATKYLDSYLRWFHLVGLKHAAPRACLTAAMNPTYTRFAN